MKNKKLIIGICIAVIVIALIIAVVWFINYTKNSIVEDSGNPNAEANAGAEAAGKDTTDKDSVDSNGKSDGKEAKAEDIKIDEKDLKGKIEYYLIYENFMQDFYVPEQDSENANIVDYANEAKVLIGYSLVQASNPESSKKPSEEQVRKAVEEYCGEHYEKFIDTAECWIAFDGNDTYDFVEAGDYDATGYCNEIEKIEKTDDGKYIVTFTYSRPSDWDIMDNTLDKVQKYRKQFTFVYHPDAKYTKYQLTELSFLKGEEV